MLVEKEVQGKIPLEEIPPEFLQGMGKVLLYGKSKYQEGSFKGGDCSIEEKKQKLIGACLRHLNTYRMGIEEDEESGLHPLFHLATDVMFLCRLEEECSR